MGWEWSLGVVLAVYRRANFITTKRIFLRSAAAWRLLADATSHSCSLSSAQQTQEMLFFASPAAAGDCNEKRFRVAWRQCDTRDTVVSDHGQAQREAHRVTKISIINNLTHRSVSEIKLIRTDTTLDLSQKAEKLKKKREKKRKWRERRAEYIWGIVGLCTTAASFCTAHRRRLELLPAACCLPVGSISLSC